MKKNYSTLPAATSHFTPATIGSKGWSGTETLDQGNFTGYYGTSSFSDGRNRIEAKKGIGARKRTVTGGWGWGCPAKGKVDRCEMLAEHHQCGTWLDKNILIFQFAGRN